jgi:hypothetical protein
MIGVLTRSDQDTNNPKGKRMWIQKNKKTVISKPIREASEKNNSANHNLRLLATRTGRKQIFAINPLFPWYFITAVLDNQTLMDKVTNMCVPGHVVYLITEPGPLICPYIFICWPSFRNLSLHQTLCEGGI